MKIYIQTRFSIFKYPPSSWGYLKKYLNKYNLDKKIYSEWLYNPRRLDEKMRILNNFTKLSIESQTYKNYEWIFYISDDLPQKYKDELSKIKQSKVLIIKKYIEIQDVSLFNDQQEFISVRLDDDDGLHPTYLEKISNFNTPNEIIAPMNGLYFKLLDDNTNLESHEVNNTPYHVRGCGLGVYNNSIYSYGNHAKMHEKYKINFINDKNMFFVSVGKHTATNRIFLNKYTNFHSINWVLNN